MSRLDRYVIRELIIPFLIGTLVVVLLFQANAYIYIAKTFTVQNIPLAARFQWILFQTPSYLKMTLPVGMALAAALAMSRLTRESEMTALRSAGSRIFRVIAPVVVFGALVGVANFYITDRVVPVATRKANDIERRNAYLGMMPYMKSNAFLQLGGYAASLGVVSQTRSDSLDISDILLIDRSDPQKTAVITAKRGSYDRGIWTLKDALMYVLQGDDLITLKPTGPFRIDQTVSFDQMFSSGMQDMSIESESSKDLRKEIQIARQAHGDPKLAQVELDERYAVPASCAIFALTSAIFSVWFGRFAGYTGVLVSFFIVVLYYNAFVISTAILGKLDAMPAWLAAWLPNILFGLVGLIAIRRLE